MKSFESFYNLLSIWLIALLVTTVAFFAASCGSGGSTQIIPPPNQNQNNNNDNGLDGNDNGTTPPPPAPPVVEGMIDVAGIPITDESGLPAGVTRTTLKVIDPSEEIGDTISTIPTAAGTYAIDGLAPATVSYLNISFNTNVDLKGIGQTVTPVSINLPIQLASGVVTTVDTSIAVFAPKVTASQKYVSDDDDNGGGMDDDGIDDDIGDDDLDDNDHGSIEISYSYQGPDGSRAGKFIIDYRSNQTIYDMNDDGEYGDDTAHSDNDNDGIRDDRRDEDRYEEDFEDVEAEGLVEGIGGGLLTVNAVNFIIDERTNFKDGLKLAQIGVGTSVHVKGYRTPSGKIFAVEIELED